MSFRVLRQCFELEYAANESTSSQIRYPEILYAFGTAGHRKSQVVNRSQAAQCHKDILIPNVINVFQRCLMIPMRSPSGSGRYFGYLPSCGLAPPICPATQERSAEPFLPIVARATCDANDVMVPERSTVEAASQFPNRQAVSGCARNLQTGRSKCNDAAARDL